MDAVAVRVIRVRTMRTAGGAAAVVGGGEVLCGVGIGLLDGRIVLLCVRVIIAVVHLGRTFFGPCCWPKTICTIQFEVNTMMVRTRITIAVMAVATVQGPTIVHDIAVFIVVDVAIFIIHAHAT